MMNLEMEMTGFYKSCLILLQASGHSTNLPLELKKLKFGNPTHLMAQTCGNCETFLSLAIYISMISHMFSPLMRKRSCLYSLISRELQSIGLNPDSWTQLTVHIGCGIVPHSSMNWKPTLALMIPLVMLKQHSLN